MSDLPGASSEVIADYLIAVRDRMVELCDITVAEAEGRIASEFGSFDLLDIDTERYLGHEDADYWAHSVYYGADINRTGHHSVAAQRITASHPVAG